MGELEIKRSIPILALDNMELVEAVQTVEGFSQYVQTVKIHDLFDGYGLFGIGELFQAGIENVMLDLKLHDTPKSVGARCRKLARFFERMDNLVKPPILTVHCSGGAPMVRAAVENFLVGRVLGITALTSLSSAEIKEIYGDTPADAVSKLGQLVSETGLDGFVCSGQEVGMLYNTGDIFKHMTYVVPGTRKRGHNLGSHARSETPFEAVRAMATHLVWGETILQSTYPLTTLKSYVSDAYRGYQSRA